MALNSSGPISLGGSTAGQSIALELGLTVTGMISLNQTDVRTLAGVSTGAITMPTNFYGKSSGLGFGIWGITIIGTSFIFKTLAYVNGTYIATVQSSTPSGVPYSGTLFYKINSNFSTFTVTPNQIESIYGRYNSGLTTQDRGYTTDGVFVDGTKLIYAGRVQKQSAGTANNNRDAVFFEWSASTNSWVLAQQYGHYFPSGTVSGAIWSGSLYKNFDGNYYCVEITGGNTGGAYGWFNISKTNFSYVSPVISTTTENMFFDKLPYKTSSSSGIWCVYPDYNSSTSTANKWRANSLDSNYTQLASLSMRASTHVTSTVGINGELFVVSRSNGAGALRRTVWFQKFNRNGVLQWTKTWASPTDWAAQNGARFSSSENGYLYLSVYTGVTQTIYKIDYDGNVIIKRTLSASNATGTTVLTLDSSKNFFSIEPNNLLQDTSKTGVNFYAAYGNTAGGQSVLYFKLPENMINIGTYIVNGITVTVTEGASITWTSTSDIAAGAVLNPTAQFNPETQSNSFTYSAKSVTTSFGNLNI
jgi:hypothetical protein